MHDPESGASKPRSGPAAVSSAGERARSLRQTEFGKQVRDALLHLYDVPYLQRHPLTRWVQKEPGARTPGVGQLLRQELLDAIAATRPEADSPNAGRSATGPAVGGAEPRSYRILAARYVEGMAALEVQGQLGIGKSEYYRQYQRGLDAVVSLLAERWGYAERGVQLPGSRELREVPPTSAPVLSPVLRRPERPPVPLTSLLGRQEELAAIHEILERTRLLTLTGAPGTGKTRLALEVATGAADEFPAGVYFVPLAAILDPGLVLPTIAQTLGVAHGGERPVVRSIVETLGDRRILLVLDNFEQVAQAAPQLAELLQGSTQLAVLVTSRSRLRVRGEREFPVAPLPVPPVETRLGGSQVASYAAVTLFVERACDVQPDFALTDDNAPDVAEICRRLDGLPLAIELAAARAKLLPPQAMLSRLEQRLPLLTGGARDMPNRHQTLRTAIAWSYDLLDAGEQILFRRLAIFSGGCTLDAAEAVCGDPGPEGQSQERDKPPSLTPDPWRPTPILDGIESLLDKSLLRREEQPDGEPRFLMLETVREYGLEQLAAAGEVDALRRRHVDFFTGLAESQRGGNPPVSWLNRMEAEHANLRAAMDWLIGIGDAAAALHLAEGLHQFFRRHNHLAEGRSLFERALALSGASEVALAARAATLGDLGVLAWHQGDFAPAQAAGEEALALYQQADDWHGVVITLFRLAGIQLSLGQPAAARELMERSLASFRGRPGHGVHILAYGVFGRAALLEGDLPAARAQFEEGLTWARATDDRNTIVPYTMGLGETALRQGNLIEARSFHAESLQVAAELGDREAIAAQFEQLAGVAAAEDRPGDVLRLIAAARVLRDEIGTPGTADSEARVLQLVEAAESALGEVAGAAVWAEGRELTLEQAIALARGNAT